ncbi:MAG: hypothetical protein LBP36_01820 [Oscillospiraceae bacterium]|jgi:hypothetical protein|nr:hypothetical protein [Oscillospiraceae bacterium]
MDFRKTTRKFWALVFAAGFAVWSPAISAGGVQWQGHGEVFKVKGGSAPGQPQNPLRSGRLASAASAASSINDILEEYDAWIPKDALKGKNFIVSDFTTDGLKITLGGDPGWRLLAVDGDGQRGLVVHVDDWNETEDLSPDSLDEWASDKLGYLGAANLLSTVEVEFVALYDAGTGTDTSISTSVEEFGSKCFLPTVSDVNEANGSFTQAKLDLGFIDANVPAKNIAIYGEYINGPLGVIKGNLSSIPNGSVGWLVPRMVVLNFTNLVGLRGDNMISSNHTPVFGDGSAPGSKDSFPTGTVKEDVPNYRFTVDGVDKDDIGKENLIVNVGFDTNISDFSQYYEFSYEFKIDSDNFSIDFEKILEKAANDLAMIPGQSAMPFDLLTSEGVRLSAFLEKEKNTIHRTNSSSAFEVVLKKCVKIRFLTEDQRKVDNLPRSGLYQVGDVITQEPTRPHYLFDGWMLWDGDLDESDLLDSITVGDSDAIYFATWTPSIADEEQNVEDDESDYGSGESDYGSDESDEKFFVGYYGELYDYETGVGVKGWFNRDPKTLEVTVVTGNKDVLDEVDNPENIEKIKIVDIKVFDEYGESCQPVDSVTVDVRLEGSWDASEIEARYVSLGTDETVKLTGTYKDANDGNVHAVFEVTHLSPYAVIDRRVGNETTDPVFKSVLGYNPKTGESITVAVLCLASLSLACAMFIVAKRSKIRDEE